MKGRNNNQYRKQRFDSISKIAIKFQKSIKTEMENSSLQHNNVEYKYFRTMKGGKEVQDENNTKENTDMEKREMP